MKGMPRGWTDEEDAALLKATDAARRQHLPLKDAFDEIASALHRRPTRNARFISIRSDNWGHITTV